MISEMTSWPLASLAAQSPISSPPVSPAVSSLQADANEARRKNGTTRRRLERCMGAL
jgi:hypothetical protein